MDRKLFKRAAIERLFDEHKAGYIDHYDRIWRLLNLELWHRVCIEEEGQPSMALDREEAVAKNN
jgi:asparagine synthase (glutamine-hydrolysing)